MMVFTCVRYTYYCHQTYPRHNISGGYYVFFETTIGNAGDKAQLGSPPLTLDQPKNCLVFYYTMYGADVGKVMVLLHHVRADVCTVHGILCIMYAAV